MAGGLSRKTPNKYRSALSSTQTKQPYHKRSDPETHSGCKTGSKSPATVCYSKTELTQTTITFKSSRWQMFVSELLLQYVAIILSLEAVAYASVAFSFKSQGVSAGALRDKIWFCNSECREKKKSGINSPTPLHVYSLQWIKHIVLNVCG